MGIRRDFSSVESSEAAVSMAGRAYFALFEIQDALPNTPLIPSHQLMYPPTSETAQHDVWLDDSGSLAEAGFVFNKQGEISLY